MTVGEAASWRVLDQMIQLTQTRIILFSGAICPIGDGNGGSGSGA